MTSVHTEKNSGLGGSRLEKKVRDGKEIIQPARTLMISDQSVFLPNGEVADAAKLTMNGTSSAGTLAVAHDPVKPAATSPLPAEVRK